MNIDILLSIRNNCIYIRLVRESTVYCIATGAMQVDRHYMPALLSVQQMGENGSRGGSLASLDLPFTTASADGHQVRHFISTACETLLPYPVRKLNKLTNSSKYIHFMIFSLHTFQMYAIITYCKVNLCDTNGLNFFHS